MNEKVCNICIDSTYDEWHILPDKFISDSAMKKIRKAHNRRLEQYGNMGRKTE